MVMLHFLRDSTSQCNSIRAKQVENVCYYPHTHPPNVDMQIPVYSVFGGIESRSVEQAEYAVTNKPKEQKVFSERPPQQAENLITNPNHETQKVLLYAQPDLSKKKKSHPLFLNTSNECPPPIPTHNEDDWWQ